MEERRFLEAQIREIEQQLAPKTTFKRTCAIAHQSIAQNLESTHANTKDAASTTCYDNSDVISQQELLQTIEPWDTNQELESVWQAIQTDSWHETGVLSNILRVQYSNVTGERVPLDLF